MFLTAKEEMKATVFYPVIDHMCGELRDRFCSKNHTILGQLYTLLMSFKDTKSLTPEVITSVSEFYGLELVALKAELHVLHNCKDLHDIASVQELSRYLIRMNLMTWFPVLSYLMRVYLCLPVSSSTSERSFSQLKLIKDEKRSTMSEPRLRGLALMKIEHRCLTNLKVSDVVHRFVNKKDRRQNFV